MLPYLRRLFTFSGLLPSPGLSVMHVRSSFTLFGSSGPLSISSREEPLFYAFLSKRLKKEGIGLEILEK